MITMGCDIGSLFSKAVIMDGDDMIAGHIADTTGNIADEIDDLCAAAIAKAKITPDQIKAIVATGSGADLVKNADFIEDDVACAGAAAAFYDEDVQLVIDIGGQSITSMLLDAEGVVTNFMRNDKCASGSGRFLEVMSRKLGIGMQEIDKTVARSEKPVLISNQCAVFAESEVISHVNAGEHISDIFAGICASVANMVVAQGRKFADAEHFTVTGGVARIDSVVEIIRQKLNGAYRPFPYDPGLATAIGAALLADSE